MSFQLIALFFLLSLVGIVVRKIEEKVVGEQGATLAKGGGAPADAAREDEVVVYERTEAEDINMPN